MTLQSAAAQPGVNGAPEPPGAAPPRGTPAGREPGMPAERVRRPRVPASPPTMLRLLLTALLVLAAAWGAVGAWTVSSHTSAATGVVDTSEPLSLAAQQMYQSLSDADVTATTAFLSGPDEPLAARQRYQADIRQAAADLAALKAAAAGRKPAASLATVAQALPVYTGYVAQAQTDASLGFQLTGGSFIQVASEEMHLTLLPAARTVYARENAALASDSARASGLPWIIITVALAVVAGLVLYWAQRWLRRRTHRIVNYGLLTGSAALVLGVGWLLAAFWVAHGDLQRAAVRGSAPAETLAQAQIAVQQARGDEILNLISRTGDSSFVQDYQAVRRELGPGPGTLLTRAAAAGGPGASWLAAAGRDARSWYTVNDHIYSLDVTASYAAETRLVIGSGPGRSAAGFSRLESDLGHALAADQVIFAHNAAAGARALNGLEAGVIAAALLMAAGSAWGVSRRLAEYR